MECQEYASLIRKTSAFVENTKSKNVDVNITYVEKFDTDQRCYIIYKVGIHLGTYRTGLS